MPLRKTRSWAYISDEQLLVFGRIVPRTTKSTCESTSSGKRRTSERSFTKGRTDLTGNRRRAESGLGLTVLSVESVGASVSLNESLRTYLSNEAWSTKDGLLREVVDRTFGALPIGVFNDPASRSALMSSSRPIHDSPATF